MVGYLDAYLPEELILAHGFLPYRVTVDGRDEQRATERIQGYACPAARSLLDQAMRGDLDFLDGVLFTRYCDSLRGVHAVWDAERLTPHVDFVRYPTVTTTEAAVTYLAAELREVSTRLGHALGAPADGERLREAVAAGNSKRRRVAELAARRARRSLPLMGADYLAVLVAATTLPTREFLAELDGLLAAPPAGEPGDAVSVVLSGVTFDNVALARAIEQTGLYLVGDDLATGSRWWTVTVDEGDPDPWRALARGYLTKPPCSVKEPSAPRADHLLGTGAGDAGGRRALLPHALLRLGGGGVALLARPARRGRASRPPWWRASTAAPASNRSRTRLEAFRESLEEGRGAWECDWRPPTA